MGWPLIPATAAPAIPRTTGTTRPDTRPPDTGTPAGPPGLAHLPSVSLAEVNERAALVTRTCRKYLVPTELMPALFAGAEERFAVMEIGGRTSFLYSSTYLDTPELRTFHDHRQGRRLRYKVRTRTYVDTDTRMFEVKLKGARGITDKVRAELPMSAPADRLTPATRSFLDRALNRCRLNPPDVLTPSAVTDYRRTTVVDLSGEERVTIDHDLVGYRDGWAVQMRPDMMLLEIKTKGGLTSTERRLHELGVREARFSKYAAALAALEPALRGNRWHRAMGHCLDHPAPVSAREDHSRLRADTGWCRE